MGLMNATPVSFQSQAVWMPIPEDSTLKVGTGCIVSVPHRETKIWVFPPNCMARYLGRVLGGECVSALTTYLMWTFSKLPKLYECVSYYLNFSEMELLSI